MKEQITIEEIRIYPIKSCLPVSVEQIAVRPWGLQYDREWMLCDPDGRFISLRDYPRMNRIQVSIQEDGLSVRVIHESIPALLIPFRGNGKPISVEVWGNAFRAWKVSETADEWFSAVLGKPVQLVWLGEKSERKLNPERNEDPDRVSFADGYPCLVTSVASLNDLNHRLQQRGEPAIPVDRFRPNLILDGLEPYAEEQPQTLQGDGVALELIKPCERCVVTTLDAHTATFGKEPLSTLASYHRGEKRVHFGMNGIFRSNAGSGAILRKGQKLHPQL